MLATTPSKRLDKHLVSISAPASFAAEQYMTLRMKLESLRRTRDLCVIAVTSPGAGDGKTVTSINLAASLSRESDARVLLIDGDLRRSALAKCLGINDTNTAGLTDAINGEAGTIDDVIQQVDGLDFDLMTVGTARESVHKTLASPRLQQLLDEARQRYDFVILDTPPLVPVFDSSLLAPMVDGLLIVVAANKTPRKLLEEALNLLDPAKVLGLVFNGDAKPIYGQYSGYYGYKQRSQRA